MSVDFPNRRDFLRAASAGSCLLVAGPLFKSASAAQPTPAASPFVRPNIGTLDPAGVQIASLRKGVSEMQKRQPTDPTSWQFQANIHGTSAAMPDPLWKQCQHGTFFFLSWHRMYLYFFERVLRAASADDSLALPYWNYNDPTQRALPVAFRDPADPANSLYVGQRNDGINDGAELPASATISSVAFALTNFAAATGSSHGFGGQRVAGPGHFMQPHGALERQPHDGIHDLLGGPDGWMSDPNTAASDPIFWLHHANIDRLWKRWLDQGGGRRNPTNDEVWMSTPFTFSDETGKRVTMTGKDIVDTAGQLNYRYDDDPPPAVHAEIAATTMAAVGAAPPTGGPAKLLAAAAAAQPIKLAAEPVAIDLKPTDDARAEVARVMGAAPGVSRLTLKIEGIDYDKRPGVYYEIYLNLPKDAKNPSASSPSYVGNLTFFGLKEAQGHGGMGAASHHYDVTGVVRALRARKEWDDKKFTVTFVMRGLIPPKKARAGAVKAREAPGGQVTIANVSLVRE